MKQIKSACLVALIGLFTLSSCVESSDKYKNLKSQLAGINIAYDSLEIQNSNLQVSYDEVINIINELEESFAQIREQEKGLQIDIVEKGGDNNKTVNKQIIAKINLIQGLLQKNKTHISSLQKQLKKIGKENSVLAESILSYEKQLKDKIDMITVLQKSIEEKNLSISNLNYSIDTLNRMSEELKESIDKQSEKIHRVFYIVAKGKELKENGIVSSSLFNSNLLKKEFNKEAFTAVDMRNINKIDIDSKRVKILSYHPEGTYTIETSEDGNKFIKILILEDDASFGLMLNNWFKRKGFNSSLCQNVQNAKKAAQSESFSIILSDLRLPDGDGIMFLSWLRENKINTPLIIMTSYGEIQSAITSMKLGAEDYIQKPINPDLLMEKINKALEKDKSTLSTNINTVEIISGNSSAAKQMDQYINLIAPTHLSVLLLGESGTGKEFAAKSIHLKSKRKDKPFVAVDCGCLSKELAPSELFGHLKGSFTSAIDNKKGVFEQANGGTLFLDEIGNLSYDIQIQLLRSIQERRIRPVGSSVDKEVDVRIITATNEDLEDAIAKGKFRQDLYHRLNEFSINIPSLKERKADIELFSMHFLKLANLEIDREISTISKEALFQLENYPWPGNLRELRNVIRRAALFSKGDIIQIEDLPLLHHQEEIKQINLSPKDEKERILQAIKRANGNKSLAAKLLGIDRKTLYNKLKEEDK